MAQSCKRFVPCVTSKLFQLCFFEKFSHETHFKLKTQKCFSKNVYKNPKEKIYSPESSKKVSENMVTPIVAGPSRAKSPRVRIVI